MPLICVASPKGGVGKTTLAANLADGLRRRGRRVLALDLDPQNGLRLHFGVSPADDAGFTAALPRRPDWRGALRETPSGVLLLPHGGVSIRESLELWGAMDRDPELLAGPVRAMLAETGTTIVVDLPPGATPALQTLTPLADLVIAVLLADGASAALLEDVETGRFLGHGTLGAIYTGRLQLVLNQVELHSRLALAVAHGAARSFGPRLLGGICRDDAVSEALACQQLLLDHAPGSVAAGDLLELVQAVEARLPPQPAPALAPAPAWRAFAARAAR